MLCISLQDDQPIQRLLLNKRNMLMTEKRTEKPDNELITTLFKNIIAQLHQFTRAEGKNKKDRPPVQKKRHTIWLKPFWLKLFCSSGTLLARVAEVTLFVVFLLRPSKPSNGWVQLIRGPRPKAGQWPRAPKSSDGKQQRQQSGGQPPRGAKEPQPERVPLHPDERMARARVRVGQLESALKALDPSDPIATHLQEALKKTQFQARVPPIESRVKVAEEYLAGRRRGCRRQRRLLRKRLQSATVSNPKSKEGEQSLARLQEEQQRFPQVFAPGAMDVSAPAPPSVADRGGAIAGPERGVVVLFQTASSQSKCEGPCKAVAGGLRSHVRRGCRALDPRLPSRHAGCNVGRERTRVGTVVPRGGQRSGPVVQEFPFGRRKCDQLSSCALRESKYGLRGCRVGEASNPGPRVKRRRRVESSSPQSGSMDGLEEDLGAVAPTETDPATTQLPSTVPSSAVSTVPASSRAVREVHAGSVWCLTVSQCLPQDNLQTVSQR